MSSRGKMMDQTEVPCGRTYDHEEHTWYTDPDKWCKGLIGSIKGYGALPIEPKDTRCKGMHNASFCVRPAGHDEDPSHSLHVNALGDAWGAHVPAPNGEFPEDLERAEVPMHMIETRPAPDWVDITEGDGALTEYATYGDIAKALSKMREDGMALGSVIYVACQKVWDDDPDAIAYGLLRDHQDGTRRTPTLEVRQCSREDAHGAHEGTSREQGIHGKPTWRCPGIDAHPKTTIGGRHDGKPAMYGQIDVGPLMGGNDD